MYNSQKRAWHIVNTSLVKALTLFTADPMFLFFQKHVPIGHQILSSFLCFNQLFGADFSHSSFFCNMAPIFISFQKEVT